MHFTSVFITEPSKFLLFSGTEAQSSSISARFINDQILGLRVPLFSPVLTENRLLMERETEGKWAHRRPQDLLTFLPCCAVKLEAHRFGTVCHRDPLVIIIIIIIIIVITHHTTIIIIIIIITCVPVDRKTRPRPDRQLNLFLGSPEFQTFTWEYL